MDDRTKKVFEAITAAADAARKIVEEFEAGQPQAPEQLATPGNEAPEGQAGEDTTAPSEEGSEFHACTLRMLPKRLLVSAAQTAIKVNPLNKPMITGRTMGLAATIEPLHIALLTTKYWGPQPRQLTVSFMEQTSADLRNRIISHMNAWHSQCGISFVYTAANGQVRISRGGGGYWSYLGTDILHIPANQQTMNLQGFTMSTPESEYKRVVRHETGHSLGAPHEHMRKELVALLDPQKTIAWFAQTQGWDQQTVQEQVLTPLDDAQLMGTPADQDSIMAYQLPGSITKNGQPIRGGVDINASDYAFMAKIYPLPDGGGDVDWLI